ncbi:MAG: hypothetical protein KGK07_04275 [Chloroflexota bacterium]|nr:hypothetical protein [Chloroflexota bacterium]
MQRDTIREYQKALARRGETWTHTGIESALPRIIAAPAAPGTGGVLRGTRVLGVNADAREDFATALRVLQRNNRLLLARFGLGWADIAATVCGEARRRGFSTAVVARLLVAALRSESGGAAS